MTSGLFLFAFLSWIIYKSVLLGLLIDFFIFVNKTKQKNTHSNSVTQYLDLNKKKYSDLLDIDWYFGREKNI